VPSDDSNDTEEKEVIERELMRRSAIDYRTAPTASGMNPTVERSGLQTRIAATSSVSLRGG